MKSSAIYWVLVVPLLAGCDTRSSSSGNSASDAPSSTASGGPTTTTTSGGGPSTSSPLKVGANYSIDISTFLPAGLPNATQDLSTYFQQAVTQLCSASGPTGGAGGSIYLPANKFKYIAHDISVTCSGVTFFGDASTTVGSGTVWDYSLASNSAISYEPAGFPSVTQSQLLSGNTVSNILFYDGNANDVTTTALVMNGFNYCAISNVGFAGSPYNAIRLHGGYNCSITNYTDNYYENAGTALRGSAVTIIGDMTGRTRLGAACSLGDCSTRVDLVNIYHLDHLGNNGVGIQIIGSVFTTTISYATLENESWGLQTSCPAGFPNGSYCPANINMTDFESEGASLGGMDLADAQGVRCEQCYVSAQSSTAGHDIYMHAVNYSGNGNLQINGGFFLNSRGSCIYASGSNINISNADITDCNAANIGAAGIEITSGTDYTITGNQLCKYLGAASGFAMSGVLVDSSATYASVNSNQFDGCTAGFGLVNSSSNTSTISTADNVGL